LKLILKSNSLEGFLLALGTLLVPIYVFDSGGIQPAHAILILFTMVVLVRKVAPMEVWYILLAMLSFHSLFLESFYFIAGGDIETLINPMFFFYNLLLVIAVYSFSMRYGISALVPGVVIACLVAFLAVVLTGVSLQEAGDGRPTGAFNNPNQLGYFSVCILSLTYLLYRHHHLKYIIAVVIFCISIFLSIASLSKAAMIANFMVAFMALKPARNNSSQKNKSSHISILFVWIFLALLGLIFISVLYTQGFFDSYLFVQRLHGIAQEDDSSLESRGYFALFDGNALQFIFGLGVSNAISIVGHEVHSTLASVLNNNGIIGFLLLSGVFAIWFMRLWRTYGFIGMCCIAGPAMLYGITHNGTRFVMFWILLGASMAMASRVSDEKERIAIH
jgi:hypothetical protein